MQDLACDRPHKQYQRTPGNPTFTITFASQSQVLANQMYTTSHKQFCSLSSPILQSRQASWALLGCPVTSDNPWHLILGKDVMGLHAQSAFQSRSVLLGTDVSGHSTDAKHGGVQRQAGGEHYAF